MTRAHRSGSRQCSKSPPFSRAALDSVCGENERLNCCDFSGTIEWAATKITVSQSTATSMAITPPRIKSPEGGRAIRGAANIGRPTGRMRCPVMSDSCGVLLDVGGRRGQRKRDLSQGSGLQPEIDARALQGTMTQEIADHLHAYAAIEQTHRK
jgi:hypothetical protein